MTKPLRRKTAARCLSAFVLLVAAAGFISWMLAAGDICDDIYYRYYCPSPDEIANQGMKFEPGMTRLLQGPEDAVSSFWNHALTKHARLANLFVFTLFTLPDWVADVLHGLMFMLTVALTCLLTVRRPLDKPLCVITTVLALWIILPWWNMKASSDYMFNYLWTSAAVLAFLYVVRDFRHRHPGPAATVAATVLAIVAAMMHEGFSVPVSAGLGAWITIEFALARKDKTRLDDSISRQCLVICLTFMAATMWHFFCPGMHERFNHEATHDAPAFAAVFGPYLICALFIWLTVALWLFLWYRRGSRWAVKSLRDNIVEIVGCAASYAIAIIMFKPDHPRYMWAALLLAAVMMLRMLFTFRLFKSRSTTVMALTGALTLALAVFYVDMTATQRQLFKEYQIVDAANMQHPGDRLVFADITSPGDEDWWVHYIATGYYHSDEWTAIVLGYKAGMKQLTPVILPTAAKGRPLSELPRIDGDAGMHLVYPFIWSERPYKRLQKFRVTFAEPEDASLSIRFNLYAIPRFAMHPRWDRSRVADNIIFDRFTVPVTERVARELRVSEGVDTLYFYRVPLNKRTLTGLRPVSINIIQ